MKNEKVMVIHKDILIKHGFVDETGLYTKDTIDIMDAILADYQFIERENAETNFLYKQIIPYVFVTYKDKYLLLRRLSKQTETRLHGKLSIGVGGHINDDEKVGSGNIIISGMYRELNEEVSVSYSKEPVFVGILNNTSSDVSRVHLGIVFKIEADNEMFEINEKDKMSGEWATLDMLTERFDLLEGWSQVILSRYMRCDK